MHDQKKQKQKQKHPSFPYLFWQKKSFGIIYPEWSNQRRINFDKQQDHPGEQSHSWLQILSSIKENNRVVETTVDSKQGYIIIGAAK